MAKRQKNLVVLVLKKRTAARGNNANDPQRDAAGLGLGRTADFNYLANGVNPAAAKQLIGHG